MALGLRCETWIQSAGVEVKEDLLLLLELSWSSTNTSIKWTLKC